jgi:hypothetical protein
MRKFSLDKYKRRFKAQFEAVADRTVQLANLERRQYFPSQSQQQPS